jgi:hypothetical protein
MKSLQEYIEAIDQPFEMPSAKDSVRVGRIKPRTWTGSKLWVHQVKTDTYQVYLVVDSKQGAEHPIGYIGLQWLGDNLFCADNAFVDPNFQKRGILSELMLFIKKTSNLEILSDTHMTKAGIALWNSLVKSPFFTAKIMDIKNNISFDFSDIGSELPDGTIAIDPKDDNQAYDYYNPVTGRGQRFFYLLESPESFTYMVEGQQYKHGYLGGRTGPDDMLAPYGHFSDGDL